MFNFGNDRNNSFRLAQQSFGVMYILTLFVNLLIVCGVLGTIIFIALKILEKIG